jgi:hypothetical protein
MKVKDLTKIITQANPESDLVICGEDREQWMVNHVKIASTHSESCVIFNTESVADTETVVGVIIS